MRDLNVRTLVCGKKWGGRDLDPGCEKALLGLPDTTGLPDRTVTGVVGLRGRGGVAVGQSQTGRVWVCVSYIHLRAHELAARLGSTNEFVTDLVVRARAPSLGEGRVVVAAYVGWEVCPPLSMRRWEQVLSPSRGRSVLT